uniref:BZIP domain-containing protein n=1 Tax=Populus trichocarpa TaxID=3694 RepID=B9GG08_POPTR
MLPPSQEDELKASHFTALSLSTDIQVSQQIHIPSQVAKKVQSTSLPYTRNSASPMKVKRKRCVDGAALTIGTGSSSNLLKMKGVDHPTEQVSCASLGGDYSRKQPPPIAAVSGLVNTSEARVVDEASPYHQFVRGVRSGNANKKNDDRRAGTDSTSYVNALNRACLYQQSASGISCENDSKKNAHPRARRTCGKTSISDKIQHRMIKNRESAARSRARKQALEAQQQVENTELKKENDLLKRAVRFLLAILRTKRMKLPALSRSFSAPL